MSKTDTVNMIINHINKYPFMEIRDICKLLYQGVFGGGHMIADEEKSYNRICAEYADMKYEFPERETPVEDIGGNMCRIYLNSMKEGLSPFTLNRLFLLSANHRKGSSEELEDKLEAFVTACEQMEVPFSALNVRNFIASWKEQGYPAISHSENYRRKYRPAYRVADGTYGKYYKVFLEIDRLLEKHKDSDAPLIVVIDGMAGSGKSTLGDILKEVYSCNLYHMDDYFLQPHQRTAERLAEPGGNVDYERFKAEIYNQIEVGKDFVYQKYDCNMHALGEFVNVSYKKLNIIEGVYSAHPYFGDRADFVFFMEISDELQLERIGARNGDRMLKRFLNEWIPMEQQYFETYEIKEKGIVIPGKR